MSAGRPRKKAPGATKMLFVRVTQTQKRDYERAAERAGYRDVGPWVRHVLQSAVDPAGDSTPTT